MAQTPVANSQESISVGLPEIALLDIEPNSSTITLELPSPQEAGDFVTTATSSNAKWINYTSAVALGNRRRVTAQLSSGTVPAGTSLKILASNSIGGAGTLGSTTGTITLNSTPQTILTNIGGAFTENGSNRGHGLTYSLEVTNVELLDVSSSSTVQITFTLLEL